MGEVAYSRAKNDEAKQAFSSAKVILDKLYVEQPKNMELLKNLGANAFWLGQLKYDESDFDGAQPLFELYRDYSERMYKVEPNNYNSVIELSYAYIAIGGVQVESQNYDKAKISFSSSLNIINEAVFDKKNDNTIIATKTEIFSWLATIEQNLGNMKNSLNLQQQIYDELETALLRDKNNANLLESMMLNLGKRAILLSHIEHYKKANDSASLALKKLNIMLNQDSSNEFWIRDEINLKIFIKLISAKSNIVSDISLPDDYLEIILTDTEIMKQTIINLIRYFQINNEWDESLKLINIAKQDTGLNLISDSVDYILMFANLHLLEAHQYLHINDRFNQTESCKKAIKLLEPLITRSRNIEHLLPYIKATSCINSLDTISELVTFVETLGIKNFNF
jgi:tetratricopeptide (TPR) repeat protein